MHQYKSVGSSYMLESEKPGKVVAIFSGIHGNEHSGIQANLRLRDELQSGEITLVSGTVIGVVHANQEAVKIKRREVVKNMNRLFTDTAITDDCYEIRRTQELKEILREVDFLLDLHSTSGPSVPFAFVEKDQLEFYRGLGIGHFVVGWGELGGDVVSGDTENYINQHGGAGITFESGNHDAPDCVETAYQLALNYLCVTGCIDYKHFKALSDESKVIHMKDVYVAKTNNFQYTISIDNFMEISQGEQIGIDGGEGVFAPYDMVLIMPKKNKILEGTEVFFVGEKG